MVCKADHVDRLRALARLEMPAEVRLLVNSLSDEEWDRLGDLLRSWPPERGWPPPRGAVLGCLDPVGSERS
jgi:hypothetical protein